MANYVMPEYSKKRVNAAGDYFRESGDVVRNNHEHAENEAVFQYWRERHTHVIDVFYRNLRKRAQSTHCIVGQRLKRRRIIIDKLQRNETMELTQMNDIAGCRVIFLNEDELRTFRADLHASKMAHELRYEEDHYNYVEKPKANGYRGIHDVYKYKTSSSSGSAWNGLLIEIQYRTKIQHAWATAVEIVDLMMSDRIKFGEVRNAEAAEFLKFASEILARAHENKTSCLPDMTDSEIAAEFQRIDRRLHLMEYFRQLNRIAGQVSFKEHVILKFTLPKEGKIGNLDIESFSNWDRALEEYKVLESLSGETTDVVLVRSTDTKNVREVFKNYFQDADEFVDLVDKGLQRLKTV